MGIQYISLGTLGIGTYSVTVSWFFYVQCECWYLVCLKHYWLTKFFQWVYGTQLSPWPTLTSVVSSQTSDSRIPMAYTDKYCLFPELWLQECSFNTNCTSSILSMTSFIIVLGSQPKTSRRPYRMWWCQYSFTLSWGKLQRINKNLLKSWIFGKVIICLRDHICWLVEIICCFICSKLLVLSRILQRFDENNNIQLTDQSVKGVLQWPKSLFGN